MNKPNQLNQQQVKKLKQQNNGEPIAIENVTIDSKGVYFKEFNSNENDVFMLNLVKL